MLFGNSQWSQSSVVFHTVKYIVQQYLMYMYVPSKRVMSSPFLHKTIFFSESCFGDLMLYVAKKFD